MKQLLEQKKSNEHKLGDAEGEIPLLRRNNRGCKSQDFYNWPEQPLEQMDTPLAVQQYIQQLIHRDPADIDKILQLPEGQDPGAWKIEHLRIFCMQLNRLAAKLQECCLPETCNQMTATEQWIFLCAAHKQPNECSAIDYTRHTLDGAANLLNSNKYFPSRVTIKESSVAKLGSVCRRVYRIFSHAYYHHFAVFEEFERETHLCKRFSKFVTIYELMSKDSLIVPSDGSRPDPETQIEQQDQQQQSQEDDKPSKSAANSADTTSTQTQRATTTTDTDVITDNVDSTMMVIESKGADVAGVTKSELSKSKRGGGDDSAVVSPKGGAAGWLSTNTMVKGSKSDATNDVTTGAGKKPTEGELEKS